MKLPRTEAWAERIDDQMIAVHIERRWDVPNRYAVMLLVERRRWDSWPDEHEVRAAAERKLRQFEAELHAYYGRRFPDLYSQAVASGVPYRGDKGVDLSIKG